MTKIRKIKKKKKYRYDINRKRMNKKQFSAVRSVAEWNTWNLRKSSQKNFKKLGFVFDVNKDIKYINKENNTFMDMSHKKEESTAIVKNDFENNIDSKSKRKNFRFSKDQVDYLTYLLDKYGDNFKAMSRDSKNYLQYTWKQIRYKINLFKSIPDHYNAYCKNKKM